ncbi:hypothetical protein ABZW18_33615 [Streptomyces sp. NPDC004647]|uniref:hypothetical protein n=1 Tax=Streptomyces sp. NPDC004647 TaxID=3154671 RepID=UPI0033AAADF7
MSEPTTDTLRVPGATLHYEVLGTGLYRPAALPEGRLGTEVVEFPGGHTGYSRHPAAFAELLAKTLLTDGASAGRR